MESMGDCVNQGKIHSMCDCVSQRNIGSNGDWLN